MCLLWAHSLLNVNAYYAITPEFPITAELAEDEYHWYKFVVPEDGWYNFYSEYTESYLDVRGELFYEIVPDGSTEGRIDAPDDLYEPDDGNDPDRNFDMLLEVNEGDAVYIRVSAYSEGSYTFYAIKWK